MYFKIRWGKWLERGSRRWSGLLYCTGFDGTGLGACSTRQCRPLYILTRRRGANGRGTHTVLLYTLSCPVESMSSHNLTVSFGPLDFVASVWVPLGTPPEGPPQLP